MLRILGIALLLLAGCDRAAPLIESTSRLDTTTDHEGPYQVQSVIIGVDTGDRVQLHYLVDDDPSFIPLLMDEVADELYLGAIPGQPAGSTVLYFVAVDRDGERLTADPEAGAAGPYQFAVD